MKPEVRATSATPIRPGPTLGDDVGCMTPGRRDRSHWRSASKPSWRHREDTKSAVPKRIEIDNRPKCGHLQHTPEVMRQKFLVRRGQLIQLVLIGALVYVAHPFISTVPVLFPAANRELVGATGPSVALTYVGAAAAL